MNRLKTSYEITRGNNGKVKASAHIRGGVFEREFVGTMEAIDWAERTCDCQHPPPNRDLSFLTCLSWLILGMTIGVIVTMIWLILKV